MSARRMIATPVSSFQCHLHAILVFLSLPLPIKASEGFCKFPLQNQTQIFKTCFLSALFFYVSFIDFLSIWKNPPTMSSICLFFPWIASWFGLFWLRKAQGKQDPNTEIRSSLEYPERKSLPPTSYFYCFLKFSWVYDTLSNCNFTGMFEYFGWFGMNLDSIWSRLFWLIVSDLR